MPDDQPVGADEAADHDVPPALDRADLQSAAARGATWTILHTVISLPVAFVVNLVVVRALGAAGFGRLAFLTALLDVTTTIFSVGVTIGLVQFGSKAHAAGRRDEVRRLLSASQGFRLLVVAPALAVLVVAVGGVGPGLLVAAVVLGVVLPASLSGASASLGIENRTARGAQVVLAASLATNLGVLVVCFWWPTPNAVWLVRLGGAALVGLLSLWSISPDYRRAVLRPSSPRKLPRAFWRFALPAGLAEFIGLLVMSRTEVFLLTWLSTPSVVGVFALAFGLSAHLFGPAQAIVGPLVPAIAGLREVDPDAVTSAFARTLRTSATLVSVLVAVALPAFATLVPVLYGRAFAPAAAMLMVLGVAGGLLVVASPVSAFVLARLSATTLLAYSGVALVVDAVLAIATIPRLGAWGAVIASVGGAATYLLLQLRFEVLRGGLTWWVVFGSTLPATLSTAAAIVSWTVSERVASTPGRLVVAVGTGSVLLLAGLALTRSGLTRRDRDVILASIPAAARAGARPLLTLLTRSGASS